MIELLRTIRAVGLGRMWKLYRAYRWGWMDIISGFYTTRTMQALFNVGFFDEMLTKGAVNVASFAASRGLDVDILESLCESLYALKILRKNGTQYVLDTKGQVLVEVARGWFDGAYGYEVVFHHLEALLRKEKTYGVDVIRRAEFVAKGSGEIEKWIYFPLAAELVAKSGAKKVLDLGCGDATFLRYLCERYPDVIGYGIDIAPEAIADGEEKVKRAGFQDRIHLFVEDIAQIEKVPEVLRDVEMATTFFVFHELLFHGPDCVVELLRGFRRLFPGVPLVAFEAIRPTLEERRKRPGMAVQYVLQHDLSHQKLVSREEWRKLFEEAGFGAIEERYLGFARTAVYTLR